MQISLPEQVWIDYEPASFGSRALAYILDFFIRWSGFALLAILLHFILPRKSFLVFTSGASIILPIIFILAFLNEWGYSIYFEVFRNGVSPGKRALGLRVVDERGLPISFRASLLRTVLALVDLLPGMGMVAFFSMALTNKSQRVGDLVAGTMVVHELTDAEGLDWTSGVKSETASTVIPLELYNIIEKYLQRRNTFTAEARQKTADAILGALESHCPEIRVPQLDDIQAGEKWLASFFRSATPAKITAESGTKDRLLNWEKVNDDLRQIETQFAALEDLSQPADAHLLFSLAQSYQLLCQQYAYLSTFYPRTSEAMKAARLVRLGRRLIYGKRLGALRETKDRLLVRVPRAFSAIKWYCLTAAAVGTVSAVIAALLVQINPNLSWHLFSEEMHDKLLKGEIWTDQIRGLSAIASSQIMTNNISVTFWVFALGLTGGVGTVLVLIMNGVHLGGIFSALTFYNMAFPLLTFIVAHGFLELSVIIVAGGCGLYIGDALLHPGSLSRKQSLAVCGRTVADLVIFNALCLVAAGLVEGYISPYREIPFAVKLTIGLILGYCYWIYLFTGKITIPYLSFFHPADAGKTKPALER